jgi:hypothetical protein
MGTWRRRIEVLSNLALIVGCVAFVALIANRFVHPTIMSPAPAAPPTRNTIVGKKLALSGVDWSKHDQTLLVILRKGCRFCDESAPFYQRLTKEIPNQTKTYLIAILPGNSDDNNQYLKEKMVPIQDVKQGSAEAIGVPGTPALVLVDNTGTVVEQWIGKLPAAQEDAVISRLKR